jgi:hypothetical protein
MLRVSLHDCMPMYFYYTTMPRRLFSSWGPHSLNISQKHSKFWWPLSKANLQKFHVMGSGELCQGFGKASSAQFGTLNPVWGLRYEVYFWCFCLLIVFSFELGGPLSLQMCLETGWQRWWSSSRHQFLSGQSVAKKVNFCSTLHSIWCFDVNGLALKSCALSPVRRFFGIWLEGAREVIDVCQVDCCNAHYITICAMACQASW